MKTTYLTLLFLLCFCSGFAQTKDSLSLKERQRRQKNIQAGNPFKKFGYKPKIATLSDGKYLEFHDLDSIVQIGSFYYHVDKKQITGYITTEEAKKSEATIQPNAPSRWLSPDPLSEEYPSWSPYNFTLNNPIRYVDPDGRSPEDIITLNSEGIVTNIIRDDRPNVFLDENGNKLEINDAEDLDAPLLEKHFEIGDKVFEKISFSQMNKAMNEAGEIKYDKDANFFERAWFKMKYAEASYSEYDFGFSYLKNRLKVSGRDMGDLYYGSGYVDGVPFLKFESKNTLYNLPDAGNFMWGHKAFLNGLPKDFMLDAAGKNEGGSDTSADTRAILGGYKYKTKQ